MLDAGFRANNLEKRLGECQEKRHRRESPKNAEDHFTPSCDALRTGDREAAEAICIQMVKELCGEFGIELRPQIRSILDCALYEMSQQSASKNEDSS